MFRVVGRSKCCAYHPHSVRFVSFCVKLHPEGNAISALNPKHKPNSTLGIAFGLDLVDV